MISKRIAQTDRQEESEKLQGSSILQRAAVRLVTDATVQSTDKNETLTYSNSAFSKNFSQVPISTTKPQHIHYKEIRKQMQSPEIQQKQGRVKPTLQAKEVAINHDEGLEREADLIGVKAVHQPVKHLIKKAQNNFERYKNTQLKSNNELKQVVQCKWDHLFNDIPKTLLNLPKELKKSRIEMIRKNLNTIRDNDRYGVEDLHDGIDINSKKYGISNQWFQTAVEGYNQGLFNEGSVREATYYLWHNSIDTEVSNRLRNTTGINSARIENAINEWNSYEIETWDVLTGHSPALKDV
ncbi:hypothetical protein [Nostoc sp. PCC 9305]|uniref:hypothetical protein n=1 Tax=Nostoc sp. PCC 9305 TaxID=296636 RepID=UPI0039C5A9F8